MTKWEIGGLSVYPVIEALLAVRLHTALGMGEADFLRLLFGLLTAFTIGYTFWHRARAGKPVIDVVLIEPVQPAKPVASPPLSEPPEVPTDPEMERPKS